MQLLKHHFFRFTDKTKALCTTQERSQQVLSRCFEQLTKHINGLPPSHVQLLLNVPDVLMFPVPTRFMPSEDFSTEELMNKVRDLMNSDELLGIDDVFELQIRYVQRLSLGARLNIKRIRSGLNYLQRLKMVWDPQTTTDNPICVVRCVAAALLSREHDPHTIGRIRNQKWFKNPNDSLQLSNKVWQIYRGAGLLMDGKPLELPGFIFLQDYLNREHGGLQLRVYETLAGNRLKFQGEPACNNPQNIIALADYENHCLWIRDLRQYFRKRNMCNLCYAFYQRNHFCSRICHQCKTSTCVALKNRIRRVHGEQLLENTRGILCGDCNRYFEYRSCFNSHKNNETCAKIHRCTVCKKTVPKHTPTQDQPRDPHLDLCGFKQCRYCKENVLSNHQCVVQQKPEESLNPEDGKFVELIFDFETYADEGSVHCPYQVWCLRRCQDCCGKHQIDLEQCNNCGQRWWFFYGPDTETEFSVFLFFNEGNKNATAISHNGSKFDTYFPLHFLLNTGRTPDSHSISGGKIISLTGGATGVTLKDSFLFIPAPLSKLPEMFGFQDKAAKGYFPHELASLENLNLQMNQHPSIEYYNPRNMKAKDREVFEHWYQENQGLPFDFKETAKSYGRQDVVVLAHAVTAFREQILDITGIDPWHSSVTLAQLAANIFTCKMMPDPEETPIGIVPAGGYGAQAEKVNSRLALIYLQYVAQRDEKQIRTAFDARGEVMIGTQPVDGVCGNEVWEISGCFYHSCFDPTCSCGQKQKPGMEHPLFAPLTHRDNHDRTLDKISDLEGRGYIVHHVWEHTVRQLMITDPEFKTFFDEKIENWQPYTKPIRPTDALFGGRCEPIACLRELSEQEIRGGKKLLWKDVTSLYPKVMLTAKLPVGHPEVMLA